MPLHSPLGALFKRLSIWIFVAAIAVRLLVLNRFSHSPDFVPNGDDMKFYNDWALRILQGQFTDGQAFYGLPGYAWCLAGIYKLFGFNPFSVGVLQCVFDALTAVLIFRIGAEVFAAKPQLAVNSENYEPSCIGLIAALAWICFLPAQTFSMILMPTSWLVVIYWGCVWWLLKIHAPSIWRPWLAIGATIGVTAVLVATVLFLLPLVLAAIALQVAAERPVRERVPRALAAAAILFGGVFAGCSPAWIHNYFIAHEHVLLSAHSGLNLYMGNNALATGYPKIPPGLSASQEGLLRDSISLAEKEAGKKLKRVQVSDYWSQKAKVWIRENRAAWCRLMARKFANFWNAFQYDDLSIVKLLQDQGVLPAVGLRFGCVAALGLPGLIFGAWRYRRARWVAAAVLLHMAALMPVFVTERYRLCAAPGLLLFAAFGLWQLWAWLVAQRWPAVLGWSLATAGAAAFVSWPSRDNGLWSLDHFNTGIRALKTHDYDQAQRSLETAYAYVQDNTEINLALGTLWQEKNDAARAVFFYKRTLDLEPSHARALSNLGLIAYDQKDLILAERFFQMSVASEPENAKTFFLLARTRRDKGDRDGAREAIRRALQLRPGQAEFQALQAALEAMP
jgi:tetratricopeptide (TPR) repeat protein